MKIYTYYVVFVTTDAFDEERTESALVRKPRSGIRTAEDIHWVKMQVLDEAGWYPKRMVLTNWMLLGEEEVNDGPA